jgi:YrbI family 3-deoxy-D-manno-octulosonate 8-phosphate phosphatase
MAITFVEKNCKDKAGALRRFSQNFAIPLSAIAFMGDDINDLGAMELSGLAAAPSNAQPAVRNRAAFVATAAGGQGAVREFIEELLAAGAGKA